MKESLVIHCSLLQNLSTITFHVSGISLQREIISNDMFISKFIQNPAENGTCCDK